MIPLEKSLLAAMFLPLAVPSFAADAAGAAPTPSGPDRYARACRSQHERSRGEHLQGTLLWGTQRSWDPNQAGDERTSVLVSVDLGQPQRAGDGVTALKLEGARLVASPTASADVVGTVLQGAASDGKPVEVAICAAEPARDDPQMVWYRVEVWSPVTQGWENPCVATARVPDPRALAVSGVWDASGAHQDAPGKLTFACENGAITKCVTWGYKPWASKGGKSLAEVHQACTRMARADYCGNGLSHTHDGTWIDMYDALGVQVRSTEASADWDPAKGEFEAAWVADGAACLARTRDGRPLKAVLKECPGRFHKKSALDLGDGDRCAVTRVRGNLAAAPLRNRSYGTPPATANASEAAPAGGERALKTMPKARPGRFQKEGAARRVGRNSGKAPAAVQASK